MLFISSNLILLSPFQICIILGFLLMILSPIGGLRTIILNAKGYKFFSWSILTQLSVNSENYIRLAPCSCIKNKMSLTISQAQFVQKSLLIGRYCLFQCPAMLFSSLATVCVLFELQLPCILRVSRT